ncbi:MAG TPA: GAF domain-containing protein [Ktedonobacteraceae bacterium]|jgi:GAF domain-containing protein|nr:GAF domain-containing protein [Ktedonobacteraceae bacterium]
MTINPISVSSNRSARDYYTTLYQTALIISSSLELEQVLESIVKSTTEAMGAKAVGLRLLDPSTGQLRLSAKYGFSESYLNKGPVDIKHSTIDTETLCNQVVYIPDVRVDPRFQYREAARKEGLVSVICVPLEVRGEAIGVLRVYSGTMTIFHDEDIKFLSVLASLAAQSIENAQLYESLRNSYSGIVSAFWGTEIVH